MIVENMESYPVSVLVKLGFLIDGGEGATLHRRLGPGRAETTWSGHHSALLNHSRMERLIA